MVPTSRQQPPKASASGAQEGKGRRSGPRDNGGKKKRCKMGHTGPCRTVTQTRHSTAASESRVSKATEGKPAGGRCQGTQDTPSLIQDDGVGGRQGQAAPAAAVQEDSFLPGPLSSHPRPARPKASVHPEGPLTWTGAWPVSPLFPPGLFPSLQPRDEVRFRTGNSCLAGQRSRSVLVICQRHYVLVPDWEGKTVVVGWSWEPRIPGCVGTGRPGSSPRGTETTPIPRGAGS